MPAITGDYLSRQFDLIVGQDYSGKLVTARKNKLFRDALLKVAEDSYKGIASQKIRDEMGFLITTEKVFLIPGENQIYTAPLQITNITFQALTATITTYLPHNIPTGTTITIANVASSPALAPALGGTYVATVVTTTTFTIPYVYVSGTYTANSGQVTKVGATTTNYLIYDYWHLLNMKCSYAVASGLTVSGATNASPIVLTVNTYNSIRNGDSITVAGVVGNTNANGTYFVKKQNDFKIALYTDATLTTPRAGNAAYVSGGTISQIYYNQARPYLPKTKVSSLGVPTTDKPKFEHATRLLKIYPRTPACSEVTLDYIRQPDVAIDVADTVTDYAMYYPEKVLLHMIDVAAEMFTALTRDPEGMKIMQNEEARNP